MSNDIHPMLESAAPMALELALRGGIILLIAAGIVFLLRGSSAAVRHAVWAAALTAVLVLPLLLASVPTWNVPLTTGIEKVSVQETSVALAKRLTDSAAQQLPEASAAMGAGSAGTAKTIESTVTAAVPEMAKSATRSLGDAGAALFSLLPGDARSLAWWIGFLWLTGALFVAVRWIGAFMSARRLLVEASEITDPAIMALANDLASDLQIGHPVRLLASDRLAVPVVWCLGRCAVVLPGEYEEWSEERLEVVLVHELAHVARHDGITQVAAQAALVLHWFNPLAWVAYRQMLHERELACDDIVLASGTRPSAYAAHLLEIARRYRQDSLELLAVAAMARNAELTDRIESILGANQERSSLSRAAALAVTIAAALIVLPLAAFSPSAPHASLTGAASAQDQWTWQGRIAPGGSMEIYGTNGAVTVEQGTSRRASVVGEPRRGFRGAELVVNQVGSTTVVCVVYDGQRGCEPGRGPRGSVRGRGNNDVNLTVVLPRDVNLSAQTVNGAVRATDLDRGAVIRSTNGAVSVSARSGDVDARTTNGQVRIQGAGRLTAHTTNGAIEAVFDATTWSGTSRLSTTNGAVRIVLPASPNVDVSARARRGSLRSDFAEIGTSRSGHTGVNASGRIGNGGRQLEIETTNGAIAISRSGDRGATLNQSVDVVTDHPELHALSADLAAAVADITRLSLESASVALETVSDVLADLDFEETVRSGLAAVDAEQIRRDVELAVRDARIDHEDIRREVEQALRDARIDHEAIRLEVERAVDEVRRELRSERLSTD